MKKINVMIVAAIMFVSFGVSSYAGRVDEKLNFAKRYNEFISNISIRAKVRSADLLENNKVIVVDGGNLSGHREPNVKVDVGFGEREYWAYTNEYGQLVKVTAKKIVPQDESREKVTSKGRYYKDEAKVKGVESPTLDEGHVIADSLGGVANAYNITPQNSIVNQQGNQAYMEKTIRDAGGATDFTAIISYPNTTTQIPSHYSMTYTVNGHTIHDEFDNIDPDDINIGIYKKKNNNKHYKNKGKKHRKNNHKNKKSKKYYDEYIGSHKSDNSAVKICKLDKKAEYIVLKNESKEDINLKNWTILSVRGKQRFTFDDYILKAKSEVVIGDSRKNKVDFHWLGDGNSGIWSNSKRDDAKLFDDSGKFVHKVVGR